MVQALCERGGRYYCFLAVTRGLPATRAIEQRFTEQAKRCQANDQTACEAVATSVSPKTEVDLLCGDGSGRIGTWPRSNKTGQDGSWSKDSVCAAQSLSRS